MLKLSVIIVNYNVRDYLEQCLLSVRKALKDIEGEVFVVDNHSKDGSVGYLKARFPDVTFIESNCNLGFARANNLAIRRSSGEYLLLLNPDTIVGEGVFTDVLRFMDAHPRAGGAGVQMLKTNGERANESRRGLPTPMTAFWKMTGMCARFPKNKVLGRYYMGYLPWDEPSQIEVVSGAFCMLRRSVLDVVGLLDEDFFMYGEDIDLSYRILKAGYENWYVPARILHYKGESTEKSSFRYVHVFYGAMLIFFRKHYGHLGFWLSIPIRVAVLAKAAVALAALQLRRLRSAMGFVSRKRDPSVIFGLKGEKSMQVACREILLRKGQTVNDNEGLLSDSIKILVYDADKYGYSEILDMLVGSEGETVLATYHAQTGKIITEWEVYE